MPQQSRLRPENQDRIRYSAMAKYQRSLSQVRTRLSDPRIEGHLRRAAFRHMVIQRSDDRKFIYMYWIHTLLSDSHERSKRRWFAAVLIRGPIRSSNAQKMSKSSEFARGRYLDSSRAQGRSFLRPIFHHAQGAEITKAVRYVFPKILCVTFC